MKKLSSILFSYNEMLDFFINQKNNGEIKYYKKEKEILVNATQQ
jgi:hypothetical protein